MTQLWPPSEISWVLGEVDTMMPDEKTKIPTIMVKSEKIIASPEWDKWTTKGDIALVKLAKKVDLKTYTPACLANSGASFDGKKAWVYGWGQLGWDKDAPAKLQKLEVTVTTREKVKAWAQKVDNMWQWTLEPGMLPVATGAGKDACRVSIRRSSPDPESVLIIRETVEVLSPSTLMASTSSSET